MSESRPQSRSGALCPRCDKEFTEEEIKFPNAEREEWVVCDACYDELYMDDCTRCNDRFDKTHIDMTPGSLIGIWRDAPGLTVDLKAGYYRVLSWPFYADGMITANFYQDALRRVSELDAEGKAAAEREQCLSGPMCKGCQGAVALEIFKASSAESEKQALQHPQSHDEAKKRIEECVREIEMIADSFGYDQSEWLAGEEA